MTFKEALLTGDFIVTVELTPPKGVKLDALIKKADKISSFVDGINVTDCQRGNLKVSSLASCVRLEQNNHSAIWQMSCKHKNLLALQSDILAAQALGIEQVLVLSGDSVKMGDHKDCPGLSDVKQVDSIKMIEVITSLNKGFDAAGHLMKNPPNILIGAVANPNNLGSTSILRLIQKIEAGAKFIQTQPIYDIQTFETFLEKIDSHCKNYDVKVLAGILPPKSYQMAEFMNKSIPGVKVPIELLEVLQANNHEYGYEAALDFTATIVEELKSFADGIHIMAIGLENKLDVILNKFNLR